MKKFRHSLLQKFNHFPSFSPGISWHKSIGIKILQRHRSGWSEHPHLVRLDLSGKLRNLFFFDRFEFSNKDPAMTKWKLSAWLISKFLFFIHNRTILRITKAPSGLKSHSLLNILSNHRRFASRQRFITQISTKRVRCAYQ